MHHKISRDIHCPLIELNHPISVNVLPNSCWKSMRMSNKAPDNIMSIKTSRDPLANFYGRPSLLCRLGRPSFSGVLVSLIAPKAVWYICVYHIQLWAVAVGKLPSQTKVAIMPTNSWPVIIAKLLGSQFLGFLR